MESRNHVLLLTELRGQCRKASLETPGLPVAYHAVDTMRSLADRTAARVLRSHLLSSQPPAHPEFVATRCIELRARKNTGDAEEHRAWRGRRGQIAASSPAADSLPAQGQDDNNDDHDENDRPDTDIHR